MTSLSLSLSRVEGIWWPADLPSEGEIETNCGVPPLDATLCVREFIILNSIKISTLLFFAR